MAKTVILDPYLDPKNFFVIFTSTSETFFQAIILCNLNEN